MKPYILEETGDFAVVYKPPRMHCAVLKQKQGGTLLEWYGSVFPPVLDIAGRKEVEGGLVHRLDFETHGLVLFAKNQKSFDFFQSLQEKGGFIKEYGALCERPDAPVPGLPAPPDLTGFPQPDLSVDKPFVIESFFRPFGPARKQVRPVTNAGKKHRELATDRGTCYRTEITGFSDNFFTIRIKRGFRHQIRCHLRWIGYPVLNDPLYGTHPAEGTFLALCCQALFFIDPASGDKREYRIAAHPF
jgi:23S rRNA pseudouridine1911/1915/1917 synthase